MSLKFYIFPPIIYQFYVVCTMKSFEWNLYHKIIFYCNVSHKIWTFYNSIIIKSQNHKFNSKSNKFLKKVISFEKFFQHFWHSLSFLNYTYSLTCLMAPYFPNISYNSSDVILYGKFLWKTNEKHRGLSI